MSVTFVTVARALENLITAGGNDCAVKLKSRGSSGQRRGVLQFPSHQRLRAAPGIVKFDPGIRLKRLLRIVGRVAITVIFVKGAARTRGRLNLRDPDGGKRIFDQ